MHIVPQTADFGGSISGASALASLNKSDPKPNGETSRLLRYFTIAIHLPAPSSGYRKTSRLRSFRPVRRAPKAHGWQHGAEPGAGPGDPRGSPPLRGVPVLGARRAAGGTAGSSGAAGLSSAPRPLPGEFGGEKGDEPACPRRPREALIADRCHLPAGKDLVCSWPGAVAIGTR